MSISHNPRKPLSSQKNNGGDMCMCFFARPRYPRTFGPFDAEQLIKSFNVETVAGVLFPPPEWLADPQYSFLQADTDGYWAYFSLNIAMYPPTLVPSDWNDKWFFMSARVHPYALTWEVNSQFNDDMQEYTIPVLMIRDQYYQPVAPRMFNSLDSFPMHSPIVGFTGLVIGDGHALLNEASEQLGDDQLKLCGFVQLTTYITPEYPNQTPWKGFHPFQVFVIWPIHMKPWSLYYQKMMDRGNSPFWSGLFFSCTGKVAGFLDHRFMVNPPELEQDRVFIVVPDSWKFHNDANRPTSTSPSITRQPAVDPYNRSAFMTPSKQRIPKTVSNFTPYCLPTPTAGPSSTKRPNESDSPGDVFTPSKKGRGSEDFLLKAEDLCGVKDSEDSEDSDRNSTMSSDTLICPATQPSQQTGNPPGKINVKERVASLPSDDAARPQRIRHPPKKYSGSD